jgi:hypothetical protein
LLTLKKAQAFTRQSLELLLCHGAKEYQAVRRQGLGLVVFTLKESSSGPKTRLGASRFHDPKESPSGQRTKLGANPFEDCKESQAVRRQSLERGLVVTQQKAKGDRRQILERVLRWNLNKANRSEDKAGSKSFV